MPARNPVLRVGLVGCGRVAELRHLPTLLRLSGVTVGGIADNDKERLRNMAELFDISRAYPDFRELVSQPGIDVVAVCVPPVAHREVAVAAMEAGKHVMIEKPLAPDLNDCDAIVQSRRATQRAAVGFNLRSHPLIRQARQWIREGVVGQVETMTTSLTGFHAEIPAWRHQRRTGGGVLFEQAVHHVDLSRYLLSAEVEDVFALTRSDEWEDFAATVTMRMTNDVVISSTFCEKTSAANEVRVHGDKGSILLDCYRFDGLRFVPASKVPGSVSARASDALETVRNLPNGFSIARKGGIHQVAFNEHWRRFLDSIHNDGDATPSLKDGRCAVQVVLGAIRAARTGLRIRVSEAPRTVAEAVAA